MNKEKNNSIPPTKEIVLDRNKVIMSKTDSRGIILYANDYFLEIANYEKSELLGRQHNIVRHPDMPKIVFKILWEHLHNGENIYAVVKNLTKDGNFYWVVTKFETTFDENGNILAHYARRKAVPKKVKETAESIYKIILQIEKHDEKLAEETFYQVLQDYNLTYDEFFMEIAEMNEEEINHFFLSTEMNVNAKNTNIVDEIEEDSQKMHNRTKESNFLGNISELNELKSALKGKDSLQ